MQSPAPVDFNGAQRNVASPRPRTIPDHELIRCIGQGSYGEVWLAKSIMGSYRAIKFVDRKNFKEERPFQRELEGIQKFEPISRSHEGLIDVLHVGINPQEGYFYYVMELGDDQRTAQHIVPESYCPKTLATELSSRSRLTAAECLKIGLALAQALEHLHAHHLVHRDIKPSNIIFVNGVPKLADIGLVMDIGGARSYVGTEGFIPPEGPGTTGADIYSLGKVLYELCTGKDRHQFPELPKDLEAFPDASEVFELNEVIIKACHGDPARRYLSARDLHADLVLLQNGKSVHRLRVLEERFGQFKKIGAFIFIAGLIAGLLHLETSRKRREAADFRQRQVGAQLAFGTQALETGDYAGAVNYFVEALHLDQDNRAREKTHRTRIQSVVDRCPRLVQMFFSDRQISQVEFDPSGTRLLISSWFGKAQVWDLASGKNSSPPFGPKEGLSMAAFSPDGKRVVTASEAGTASVWDATSGAEIFSMKHPDRVMSARYSADGQWIVTACKDKCARIFNATNGQLVRDLGDHADLVFDAAFSPDGQWLVTASRDSTAQIWNAKTGERHGPALQHNNWVFSAAFSPDGRRIVTSCYDRYARIWDVATFAEVHPSLAHADAVRSARFSSDGRRIVTASWDLTVRIWDAATGQLQKPNGILRHTGRGVMHASFAPDARRIATGCIDGTTRVWDLAGGENLAESLEGIIAENAPVLLQTNLSRIDLISLQDPDQSLARIEVAEPIKAAGLSRNGEFVLALLGSQATSRVASLHIWNSKMGRALYAPSNCREEFHQLNLSHDGKRLAIHSGKELRFVALATGVETRLDLPHAIDWTVFSPDDHRILAVCGTEIQIIDVTSARPISKPLQHALPVKWAQFSPDTQCIVAATGDNTLNEGMAVLWSADGKRLANLEHKDGVLKIAFSPDSRRVITCSEDFTARIWEIPSGAPLTGRLLHEHQVHDAVFSADGLWVATASADRTARLWDAQSGEPVSPPLFHDAPLGKAWFSGEGQQILTRDLRGKLWRWRIGSETNGIADLQRLARFLTGYAFQNSLSPSGSLEKDWHYLRTRMPNLFQNAGIDRIKSWHQREIASAKSRKDASVAAFHQQILDAMNTVRAE